MKVSASVCINAPASKVWAILSELDSIHTWNESILRSYCETENNRGVDAVRVCELGGNVTVRETIIAWEEGQSFTYTGQGVPLVKRAVNTWSVLERGQQTLVTSSAEVEVKGAKTRGRQLSIKEVAAINSRPPRGWDTEAPTTRVAFGD